MWHYSKTSGVVCSWKSTKKNGNDVYNFAEWVNGRQLNEKKGNWNSNGWPLYRHFVNPVGIHKMPILLLRRQVKCLYITTVGIDAAPRNWKNDFYIYMIRPVRYQCDIKVKCYFQRIYFLAEPKLEVSP